MGLPCHIHGIRKLELQNEKIRERIRYHIGIFCGYTYSFLATEYLLQKYGINGDDIVSFSYRGEGWPGSVSIHFKDSSKILISTLELYEILELTFRPDRCSLCCDASAELSDISCGDAWLPEFSDDALGTSIIITRNKIGEKLLSNATQNSHLDIREISPEKVITSQPLFMYKKAYIHLFMRLAKLQGRLVPQYKTKLVKLNFSGLFKAGLEVVGPMIGKRRKLWWLIPLWHYIYRKLTTTVPEI